MYEDLVKNIQLDNSILQQVKSALASAQFQPATSQKVNTEALQTQELIAYAQNNPNKLVIILEPFDSNINRKGTDSLFCECDNIIHVNNKHSTDDETSLINAIVKQTEQNGQNFEEIIFDGHAYKNHMYYPNESLAGVETIQIKDILSEMKAKSVLPTKAVVFYGCKTFSNISKNDKNDYGKFSVDNQISIIGTTSKALESNKGDMLPMAHWLEFKPKGSNDYEVVRPSAPQYNTTNQEMLEAFEQRKIMDEAGSVVNAALRASEENQAIEPTMNIQTLQSIAPPRSR